MKNKIIVVVSAAVATLWLPACAVHQVEQQSAVTLQTGNEVLDAASYVAAGLYLSKQQAKGSKPVSANDPAVKALDAAFDRAKAGKPSARRLQPRDGSEQPPN